MPQTSTLPVVVVAGTAESMNALTRLFFQLPSELPAPVVAVVRGLQRRHVASLVGRHREKLDKLVVLPIDEPVSLHPGRAYVVAAQDRMVFTAPGTLGYALLDDPRASSGDSAADALFATAARTHGSRVIGVVLSGEGSDGSAGLRAITAAGGTSVVQTPCEASQPQMPLNALMNDHVQHSVVLDDMGRLLCSLVRASVAPG